MFDFINKALSGIFGNKSEKDMKELTPFVAKIKEAEKALAGISTDELRAKSDEFKRRIQEHITSNKEALAALNSEFRLPR